MKKLGLERHLAAVVLLVVVALAGCGGGDDDSTSSPAPASSSTVTESPAEQSSPPAASAEELTPPFTEDDPEYQLAVIDDRASSPSDEDAIRPYARQLDLLQRKCTNRRSRLADFVVTTVKQAASANISTTNLNVLRNVRGSLPTEWKRQGCLQLFALYTAVLVEG